MHAFPSRFVKPARRLALALALAFGLLAGSGAVGSALAQGGVDLSTENVTVDLSVIQDSGGRQAGAPAYMAAPRSGGGPLLLPGRRDPISELHVRTPMGDEGRVRLRPPGTKKKPKPAPKPAPKAAKAKPAAAPPKAAPEKPSVAASAPPAPLTSTPAEKPAPAPEKSAPPADTAAAAPPAPPPAAGKPAPPPAPAAAQAAAEPKPQEAAKTEQASLPPAEESLKPGRALQVTFEPIASKLPDGSKGALKALAEKMKSEEALRLQLMAYAGSKDLSTSKARRLSLSRALSVRSFLIESGIRSTRIDVRALGSKTSEEPMNRVDVNIVER